MAKKKTDADAAADEAVDAAETTETTETTETEEVAPVEDTGAGEAETPQIRQRITVDDGAVEATYSNFCRAHSTPEELILDLGLNPTPFANGDITVPVTKRIIMNHITAKRMLAMLSQTLQRHEQLFGVIELDVNRRLRPQG